MSESIQTLSARLQQRFPGARAVMAQGELTLEVPAAQWLEVCAHLRDEEGFEQLMDLCGVDYSAYGQTEWETTGASSHGFCRGVSSHRGTDAADRPHFAAVIHLLSVANNRRIRVRCFAEDNDFPVLDSVVGLWNGANWYEREAFDLFGIHFQGHPDLRRLLTDYGFVGHPFRKDFPLSGHVEMRFDPEKQRVVYQPVSIEPRVLVPRVIREDHRYAGEGMTPVKEEGA